MSIRMIEPPELGEHRDELASWLTANGVDPKDVTADRPVVIEQHDNGLYDVWYFVFVRTLKGERQVDPHVRGRAWAEQRRSWVQDVPDRFRDFA